MKTIHKYPLEKVGTSWVDMPVGAKVLCVQEQHGRPTLWAVVDLDAPMQPHRFFAATTGSGLGAAGPDMLMGYVGTVQMDGGAFVVHVFQL